ncbi:hypothetical protein ACLOJK_033768 [Asimina triloba]
MAEYDGEVTAEVTSGNMVFEPILEEGVFQFDCSGNDRYAAYPSISFLDHKVRDTPIAIHQTPEYIPTFQRLHGQQIVCVELPPGSSLYGTGEVSGQLERTGKKIFTWNTDAWGYGPGTTSLYQSHPWVLIILPDGKAYGVLADTTRRCEIDLRKESTIKFTSPAAYPVVTFGPFSSPTAVLVSLSHAIGYFLLIIFVAKTFRKKGIPCDVIWMDIDYMDGFRCFTFDKDRFSDPKSLVNDLHVNGFKAIWMLDPGLKHEKGYSIYDSGCENDVWIKTSDGEPFVGHVWPGPCVFPDFTQERTRLWWAKLVKDFSSNGVDGIWNDMNEPAVFKARLTVTKTMPQSNIHNGDAELGGRQNHSYYHNVYGMLMARSTYEGMKMATVKKRPFVLTRAGFIGSQRYAATWTGDNLSNWEHLHMSISMVLQLGLSGQPLSGPDIGGFAGNATPKLFGRWMAVGAMFPFCRAHSEADTSDHEPWSFGEEMGNDLPTLYLKGGSIIPVGPPIQHVGEAMLTDDLSLIVALDEDGKAEGVLFEDEGDGYGFNQGDYLLTYYVAELQSSVVTVKISQTEGFWKRPTRGLHIHLLLGGGAKLVASGTDGDELKIKMPSEAELSSLVTTNEDQYIKLLESAKGIPDTESHPGQKGMELSKTPVEMKSGDWVLKVVPWIGGRMISMMHLPSGTADFSDKLNLGILHEYKLLGNIHLEFLLLYDVSGTQWLHSRVEIDGYEEYSGVEYRSAGCSEEYAVIMRNVEQLGEDESLILEGDIGGGIIFQRQISIPRENPKVLRIDSGIIARSVGAGSGGFSRLVCLRVHPTFTLLHPTEVFIEFISIDGIRHEIWPDSGEQFFEGDLRPNADIGFRVFSVQSFRSPSVFCITLGTGEWMLVDKALGMGLVNRFKVDEVYKCMIHWGTGTVNMELFSEDRPVSKESPLTISHEYEVKPIA